MSRGRSSVSSRSRIRRQNCQKIPLRSAVMPRLHPASDRSWQGNDAHAMSAPEGSKLAEMFVTSPIRTHRPRSSSGIFPVYAGLCHLPMYRPTRIGDPTGPAQLRRRSLGKSGGCFGVLFGLSNGLASRSAVAGPLTTVECCPDGMLTGIACQRFSASSPGQSLLKARST